VLSSDMSKTTKLLCDMQMAMKKFGPCLEHLCLELQRGRQRL